MKVYEALYCEDKFKSAFTTISIHQSEYGARKAINNHKYNRIQEAKKQGLTGAHISAFELWKFRETELQK